MLKLRKNNDRGRAHFGWLESRHTFSFGHYRDPHHRGFRTLRVINEDRVSPGAGFEEHGHANMEILSYVIDGALEHKDSLGTGSVIRPGELQRMSAGTGIRHSEFNYSQNAPVHFLQIWIIPDAKNITPGYEQKDFGGQLNGQLKLIASRDAREGSVTVHQDVDVYASRLENNQHLSHHFSKGRHGWLQIVHGSIEVEGQTIQAGDGLSISDKNEITVKAQDASEFLLFDLA